MQLVGLIIGTVAAAAYLTSVLCRLIQTRHRRVAWWIAIIAPMVVAFLTVMLIFQGTVFDPREWLTPSYFLGTTPIGVYMLCAFGVSTGIGLIPALFIVRYYRRMFTHVDPATS